MMSDLDLQSSTSPDDRSQAAASARPRSRTRAFFLGVLSGSLLVLFGVGFVALLGVLASDSPDFSFAGRVAVVPIEGEIRESRESIDLLHKYADNPSVRAIVIRIDSPGGAIAPSQELYEAIRSTRRESGKPFVASLDSVAASGGFYIAAACDRIVANPGSITGSIGVILEWMEVKDLLDWAKIKPQTITAGALKATGSPYKDLTAEERAYLTGVVDQLHSQFIRAVAEGRKGKMSLDEVKQVADGRIFTGEQALALKLVDQMGNLDDAVKLAGSLSGLRGKPAVVYPKRRRPGLLDLISGAETRMALEQVLSRRAPRFLYRW